MAFSLLAALLVNPGYSILPHLRPDDFSTNMHPKGAPLWPCSCFCWVSISRRAALRPSGWLSAEPDGEDQHEPARVLAQIVPDDLWAGCRAVAQAHGPVENVMHRAREHAAGHHPRQGRRAVDRAEDGPKHRPQARDIQQLDEKYLVGGQDHAIHPVGLGLHRGRPCAVNAEDLFYEAPYTA